MKKLIFQKNVNLFIEKKKIRIKNNLIKTLGKSDIKDLDTLLENFIEKMRINFDYKFIKSDCDNLYLKEKV